MEGIETTLIVNDFAFLVLLVFETSFVCCCCQMMMMIAVFHCFVCLLIDYVHVLGTGVRVHRDSVYGYTLGPLRIPT